MRLIKTLLKYVLVVFFVLAGSNHFIHPAVYLKIMPPYLPWHAFLVSLSGLCEIGFALLILIPPFTGVAGWGLIALLIAVFPANLHMALHPGYYPEFRSSLLWLRLPLQIVFIGWIYWCTRATTARRPNLPMLDKG